MWDFDQSLGFKTHTGNPQTSRSPEIRRTPILRALQLFCGKTFPAAFSEAAGCFNRSRGPILDVKQPLPSYVP